MTTMTKTRYRVLSLAGRALSEHPTIVEAAREIQKHNAWTSWSLARVAANGSSVMLTEQERREANAVRYPALTEIHDGALGRRHA